MIGVLLSRYKAFATFFSFSVATSALGFGASLLLMRLIMPAEFGKLAIFLSMQFLVAPIVSLSADNLIAINKTRLDETSYAHFRRTYVTLAYAIFGVVELAFCVVYALDLQQEVLLLLVPVAALLKFLIGLASIEYVMEEKSVQYGLVQFFTTALSLALTVVFIWTVSADAGSRIFGLILADLVFLLIRYRGRMRLLVPLPVKLADCSKIALFGFPLLMSVAPAWALNEADKIIVSRYADLQAAGIYAAACAIGNFMVTFNTSLLNSILPKLYAALARETDILSVTRHFMLRFLLISAAFAAVFLAAYALLASRILPVKYVDARPVVYWIIVLALARSLYAVLGAVTDYLGLTVQKLVGISAGAVAALAGIYLGIQHFGVVGAAFGVGAGYTVLALVLWFCLMAKARSARAAVERCEK